MERTSIPWFHFVGKQFLRVKGIEGSQVGNLLLQLSKESWIVRMIRRNGLLKKDIQLSMNLLDEISISKSRTICCLATKKEQDMFDIRSCSLVIAVSPTDKV